uniref:Glycosyl transferase CAP10 domain-containing protein n=1 Tax=Araucaria cunninghamii TaxID=56994 RepID=A0A0D6QT72_ARACU
MVLSRKSNRSVRNQCLGRISVVWCIFILFGLLAFRTTWHMVSDKFRVISETKTIAGDNLEPTPWHPFPKKSLSSSGRASQIFQCYLTCTSPLGLIRSYIGTNVAIQNNTNSCPAFFQWIHEDLAPWKSRGITVADVSAAKEFAAFRVVIVRGRLYLDLYYDCVQSRMMFTVWGLLQLLDRYPGMVPDVDLMFDCMDKPKIERSKYRKSNSSPPPLFRYCSKPNHFDIPFPDWSFWGWPEVNLGPWDEEFKSIKQGSKAIKWADRKPIAYWKGNPYVASPIRSKLLACNSSSRWGAEILQQNWFEEANAGYEKSKLANQCKNRFKIYTEGFAWSVSFKYILSCDSPVLVATPEYYDFFTRGLMPQENYWPVRSANLCPSIKFAVDWGNSHPAEAQAIGKGGQRHMQQLKMDNVYDYMFHLLSEYSKLQKFRPQVPDTAQEVCKRSVLCLADPKEKTFLERSTPKTATYSQPCFLDPPNHDLFKQWTEKKTMVIKDIEKMEAMAQTKKTENMPQDNRVADRDRRMQNSNSEDVAQQKKKKNKSRTKRKEEMPRGKKVEVKSGSKRTTENKDKN